MSLEALAPDQRAVVQLVLQQERSYDDLAGLLGISTDAVRERAHLGLEQLGGPTGDLTAEERGEIADYLLGQQSVSRREATRALLASSPDARAWAREVSAAVSAIARSPLPAVPDDGAEEPLTAGTAALSTPAGAGSAAADQVEPGGVTEDVTLDDEPDAVPEEPADERAERAAVRVRPRPRPAQTERPARRRARTATEPSRPRSSRIGGALLILGVVIVVAAGLIFLIGGGDDEEEGGGNGGDATPTPTATATIQPVLEIPLRGSGGSEARGELKLYASEEGQIAFTIEATGVPQSREGEAYAVWLTGGGTRPKRLGFAPPVGEDGRLGVSGPGEDSAPTFPRDFFRARRIVVSRETSQDTSRPGPTILSGQIPRQSG